MKKTIRMVMAMAITASSLAFATTSAAIEFPTKPVRIVVPYPAGGPFDIIIRPLAQELGDRWKQPVIVDNRPGANEGVGASMVAKSPADGYTLLVATESAVMLNGLLYKSLPYNPEKDFAPITRLLQAPLMLVSPAALPANTLGEFIALARSRKDNPLVYGSAGAGGASHLPLAVLVKDNGLTMIHAPYRGAAPLIQDMLGDHQIALAALAPSLLEPYIKAGKLKGLAVSSAQRLPSLPQVPTFQETGFKDAHAAFMLGLFAPAGTPPEVIEEIAVAVRQVMLKQEFQAKYLKPYSFTSVASTPAEFREYLAKDRQNQTERVKASGVQPE